MTCWPRCSLRAATMTRARLLARTDAVAALLLRSEDGEANLLTAYRRAANILRIEDRKDGPHAGEPDPELLRLPQEVTLAQALHGTDDAIAPLLAHEDSRGGAMAKRHGAPSRAAGRCFFDQVTVNAPRPTFASIVCVFFYKVRSTMDPNFADFSKIEG